MSAKINSNPFPSTPPSNKPDSTTKKLERFLKFLHFSDETTCRLSAESRTFTSKESKIKFHKDCLETLASWHSRNDF